MKRDKDFRQDRGAWFARVDGFEAKLGVHTTDRFDPRRKAVRLFSDDPEDDAALRERQIESARAEGAIALRDYDARANSVGRKVGVFTGEVREVEGHPWFFLQRRLTA
ncbi:hypothetical protein [uncultured Albimonas sp.]|uniref:hypothetical protein n=1 Tax=uncultured Albimonas sp. TaxID=1331701 RepID=UPI0030EE9664